jgi:hypothetical protein
LPAGVPLGLVGPLDDEPPPPHAQSPTKGKRHAHPIRTLRLFAKAMPAAIIPSASGALKGARSRWREEGPEMVRAVVVTETVTVDALFAVKVTVAGAEQVAPDGAPVQLSDAVPEIPAPPIVSV